MNNLPQIHAEPEADYGRLEEKFRQLLCLKVKGMNDGESIHDTPDQRNWRGHEAAGGKDQSDEEYVF